jgi:hypothetical protein
VAVACDTGSLVANIGEALVLGIATHEELNLAATFLDMKE